VSIDLYHLGKYFGEISKIRIKKSTHQYVMSNELLTHALCAKVQKNPILLSASLQLSSFFLRQRSKNKAFKKF